MGWPEAIVYCVGIIAACFGVWLLAKVTDLL